MPSPPPGPIQMPASHPANLLLSRRAMLRDLYVQMAGPPLQDNIAGVQAIKRMHTCGVTQNSCEALLPTVAILDPALPRHSCYRSARRSLLQAKIFLCTLSAWRGGGGWAAWCTAPHLQFVMLQPSRCSSVPKTVMGLNSPTATAPRMRHLAYGSRPGLPQPSMLTLWHLTDASALVTATSETRSVQMAT